MTRRPNTRRREAPAPESRLLVVVATISLGVGMMAFVLGMRYGLDQNDRDGAAAIDAGGTLQRFDRQAAQLRDVRTREQAALSFHDTLTGPARPPVALTRDGKPLPAAPAVRPPTASAAPKAVAPATSNASARPVTDVSPAAAHLPSPPIVILPSPPMVTAPSTAGRFSLQAGAFPDEAVAKSLAAKLTARGYSVHISSAQVEGKGTWYRVRVGSYGDRAAADGDRGKLSGEGVFAIVVPESEAR